MERRFVTSIIAISSMRIWILYVAIDHVNRIGHATQCFGTTFGSAYDESLALWAMPHSNVNRFVRCRQQQDTSQQFHGHVKQHRFQFHHEHAQSLRAVADAPRQQKNFSMNDLSAAATAASGSAQPLCLLDATDWRTYAIGLTVFIFLNNSQLDVE